MGGFESFVRWERSGEWEGTNRLYERNGAADERCWGRRRVNEDHLYEGHGIEDGSCWSGGLEGTERLFSAVGENSIDFLKILYRLFRKTL